MMVPLPAPRMVTLYPSIMTCSAYVPGATLMVSPSWAASTAAWMELKQVPVPRGLTHRVAACTVPPPKANRVAISATIVETVRLLIFIADSLHSHNTHSLEG